MPLEPRLLALADQLIDFVLKGSGFQVIVCDETGTIVRATLHKRIGTVHAGALELMRSDRDEYVVTKEEATANPLVKEGLNHPIVYRGRRVGTFGVAASPFIARPLARVCSLVLSSWLAETPNGALSEGEGEVASTAARPLPDSELAGLSAQVSDLQRVLASVEQQLAHATQRTREAATKLAELSEAVAQPRAPDRGHPRTATRRAAATEGES